MIAPILALRPRIPIISPRKSPVDAIGASRLPPIASGGDPRDEDMGDRSDDARDREDGPVMEMGDLAAAYRFSTDVDVPRRVVAPGAGAAVEMRLVVVLRRRESLFMDERLLLLLLLRWTAARPRLSTWRRHAWQ